MAIEEAEMRTDAYRNAEAPVVLLVIIRLPWVGVKTRLLNKYLPEKRKAPVITPKPRRRSGTPNPLSSEYRDTSCHFQAWLWSWIGKWFQINFLKSRLMLAERSKYNRPSPRRKI